MKELAEKAAQLRCDADDLAELLRDLRGTLDFYPGELDEIEERLDKLYRLKKKYGGSTQEMLDYLEGRLTFEQAAELLKRDTRRFAKRQLTWFRRDRDVFFLDKDQFEDDEAVVREILHLAEKRGIINHEE